MFNNDTSLYHRWKRRTEAVLRLQRVVVTGLDNIPDTGGALLTPNHLNWKDVFFIGAAIPRQIHYVATNDLFYISDCKRMIHEHAIKSLGSWAKIPMRKISDQLARIIVPRARRLGLIPTGRNNHSKRLFELAKEGLKEGKLLCIFPEGTVSFRGRLLEFKKGAAKMVFDLFKEGIRRIPVLPVGVKGTDKLFFPGRKLSLHIGKPLYIDDHLQTDERETLVQFVKLLRFKVSELIKKD